VVCRAQYRRVVFSEEVDNELRAICLEISKRYEIIFLEIGVDRDHVHFLIQSEPMYSPRKIVQTIKSITAREIFKRMPSVKEVLWGGEFWTEGYFINTVGQFGNEKTISAYVKKQGQEKEYKKLHSQQLELFDWG
jgi:REP element-mobilizing transposase RayT